MRAQKGVSRAQQRHAGRFHRPVPQPPGPHPLQRHPWHRHSHPGLRHRGTACAARFLLSGVPPVATVVALRFCCSGPILRRQREAAPAGLQTHHTCNGHANSATAASRDPPPHRCVRAGGAGQPDAEAAERIERAVRLAGAVPGVHIRGRAHQELQGLLRGPARGHPCAHTKSGKSRIDPACFLSRLMCAPL